MNNNFSIKLKELRQNCNLSQKDFAESIGISAMAISTYETGSKSPSIETATKIAKKYDVSLDWLCGLSDRQTTSITPVAMSDILNLLFEIEKTTPLQISKNEELVDQNIYHRDSAPNYQPQIISEIGFASGLLNGYIDEWNKMLQLYRDHTIDEEVYSLWKEKVLIQTSCTYPDGTRIVPDIPPGEE